MNTEILPGFSIKNRDWAEDIQQFLNLEIPTSIVYWPHWRNGDPQNNWKEVEARRLAHKHTGTEINVVAKSIGTLVLMMSLKDFGLKINKIILCGIPLNDLDKTDQKYYEFLKKMAPENILVFQNEADNHGSFDSIKEFIGKINFQIKLVSKPRNDHEYPFAVDFLEFLK